MFLDLIPMVHMYMGSQKVALGVRGGLGEVQGFIFGLKRITSGIFYKVFILYLKDLNCYSEKYLMKTQKFCGFNAHFFAK